MVDAQIADPAPQLGEAPEHQVILEARRIVKYFGGVAALRDGNFELRADEIHALVGDNGAGKSTLIKIISGALEPDGGEILIDGESVRIANPGAARRLGITTVYQDLALVNHLDAAANLFLGREVMRSAPWSWFGIMDKTTMRRRAIEEVERLRVNVKSVDQLVMTMSGGQRQAMAVSRAVAFGTRIIIMDEPTAALGVRETAAALRLIEDVRAQGLAVIMISHSLPDVFEVADRITVLRLGRTVTTMERANTSFENIVGMMTGAFASTASS